MSNSVKNSNIVGRYIIDGRKVVLHRYDLIWTIYIPHLDRYTNLYYPKQKRFIIVEIDRLPNSILEQVTTVKSISETDAMRIITDHPEGIEVENYERIFGPVEDL